jgi:tRNA(adenine34) deaminase
MCAGAIVNARIKRVVYGAFDEKAGAFGTVFNMNDLPLNHKPEIEKGFMECECKSQLTEFFKKLRAEKKAEKFFSSK